MTRPLPKTRHPILKKNKNSFQAMLLAEAIGAAIARTVVPALGEGAAGAEFEALRDSTPRANTNMPRSPARMKMAVNSLWTMSVTPQAIEAKIQAATSRRRVFRPRFQHAFRIKATTTGPTP